MSQHDMDLANAAGASFRADANLALVALVSNSSGATEPATTFANMWWADTTTHLLKRRNEANSAWITVMDLTTGLIVGTDVLSPTGNGSGLTGIGGGRAQDFRLTLTTATPVTTADVTGATTIYCTPYKGNQISLYSGSAWVTRSRAEFSLALGTLTSAKPYDVFCYDNAGTPTLEFLAWTNDTTRATALAYQDGVLCKTGALTRRYLGTFYTTSTTQTEDSAANRNLFNYYNRVRKPMVKTETTASWTYATGTWRPSNNNSANKVSVMIGVAEEAYRVTCNGFGSSTSSGYIGIGADSTSSNSATVSGVIEAVTRVQVSATLETTPAAGYRYFQALEYSGATTTYNGAYSVIQAAGIFGEASV